MKKCPNCKLENLFFVDSSESITYPSEEVKKLYAKWEQWECSDCESLLDVEEGIITVLKQVGINQTQIIFRVTTDWERKFSEL